MLKDVWIWATWDTSQQQDENEHDWIRLIEYQTDLGVMGCKGNFLRC